MKLVNCAARLRRRATHGVVGKKVEITIGTTVVIMMALAMLALPPLCRAQDQEASIDSPVRGEPSVNSAIEVARADSRAERENIISAAMNFSEKDAAAFWPIYRLYEYERTALDDGRVAVIKEYTEKNATLTDAEAKSMAERMFAYDSRLATLKKKYYRKFNKVLPAFTVTKFFQLDRRIDLLQDMNVETSLPPLTRPQYANVSK